MPFTLIHMGPGAAFKALGGRRFSLMVFGFAQGATEWTLSRWFGCCDSVP